MSQSFFFYDLETSGFNPRSARIMQFAGQRTDMNLNLIAEPYNLFIKLTQDILPDPGAVLLTGITPQQTLAEGLDEAEFLKIFYKEIVKPETIFVGFNNTRFDDEFMRFINYRNFYDAYAWQWADNCSRWDLLDLSRMTRALRPAGIKWPISADGKINNRLENLAKINKLSHEKAHDALSDVMVSIELGKLIKTKQPDLFSYLFNIRNKKDVAKFVEKKQPFVYTSGHISSQYLHTSIVTTILSHQNKDSALVYDLRFDPTVFLKMSVDKLTKAWQYSKDENKLVLPVKTLKYNRLPAIAPVGVINDQKTLKRLDIDLSLINKHLSILNKEKEHFTKKILEVVAILDDQQSAKQVTLIDDQMTVDNRLYDGFIPAKDKNLMSQLRLTDPKNISEFSNKFQDERLINLLPLYKARNFPKVLNVLESTSWDKFCRIKLIDGGENSALANYFKKLIILKKTNKSKDHQFIIEELELYGQSIIQNIAPDNEAG